MTGIRYAALGDSFTEGMGDPRADGSLRGWADLVAEALAANHGRVEYANLAVRGRLMQQIVDEQLPAALELRANVVTFNGGGNDMLRPGTDLPRLIRLFSEAVERFLDQGVRVILVSGGNPMRHLPAQRSVEHKGRVLTEAVQALADRLQLPFADNWNDEELGGFQYWGSDRLHLNTIGHQRAASRVLLAMGEKVPEHWQTTAPPITAPGVLHNAAFAAQYLLPWIGRRLTSRSSGDGRVAKHPLWVGMPDEHADPIGSLP